MMKTLIVLALAHTLLTGMVAPGNPQAPLTKTGKPVVEGPSLKWEKTSHEFGKIAQGKPVTVVFNFTNDGNKPLVLHRVTPPCGCTASDFTREPVMPGKSGFVKLTFNAATPGNFSKTVPVVANTTPETSFISFNGQVNTENNAQ